MPRLRVAVAGMGFGAAFVPIYLRHPDVESVGIIDPNREALSFVGERFAVDRRHGSIEEALGSGAYDAIHLVTPIPLHARQAVSVLNAGLHCASTVPMATSLADIRAIIGACRRSGRTYMMMETAVYTRQFLYARTLVERGEMGRIQFLRGAHYQDMENWPPYWRGLPPMWYATHAIAPCLAIAGTRAIQVRCLGSGAMRPELHAQYGNPFPVETAIFQLEAPGLAMEASRTLFQTARAYTESFAVFGERMAFEWPQIEGEDSPVICTIHEADGAGRGRRVTEERVSAPDRGDLLPPEIAPFTVPHAWDDTNPQVSFETGGGHHGSHPHLVHEFVRSIVEGRRPAIDEITAANWTAAGICAHTSAMQGGRAVRVPAFIPV